MMTPPNNHRAIRKSFELQRLKSLRLRHHTTSKLAADDGVNAIDRSSHATEDSCGSSNNAHDASSKKSHQDPISSSSHAVAPAATASRRNRYLALRHFKSRRSGGGSSSGNLNDNATAADCINCSTPGTADSS